MASAFPTLERIIQAGVVAVVRCDDGGKLQGVAEALLAGGVDSIEITFTVPSAHRVLERLADQMGDRIALGAGTILDAETARIAILSGAKFIVSPITDERIIACGKRYSIPTMAGAMTPTEVVTAWQAGSDIVKVFPADSLGPSYLKALRGPLPQVRLMPTGGVDENTAAAFIRAGAVALGAGSSLVHPKQIANGDWSSIQDQATRLTQIVADTRRELAE